MSENQTNTLTGAHRTAPATRRNVLYVAIGGSGIKTLAALKRLHEASATSGTIVAPEGSGVRPHYLAIDTDREQLAALPLDEGAKFALNIPAAARWYRHESERGDGTARHLWSEWLPEMVELVDGHIVKRGPVTLQDTDGAGQRRLVSRMVAYHALSHGGLEGWLDQAIQKMFVLSDGGARTQFEVRVLFGVAGGTGSGGTMSIAAVVRELCRRHGEACRAFDGHAFLDTALEAAIYNVNEARCEANAYAALMEIEHYQKAGLGLGTLEYLRRVPAGLAGSRDGTLRIHANKELSEIASAVFDQVYLYELVGGVGTTNVYRSAAEVLFAGSTVGLDASRRGNLSNVQLQQGTVHAGAQGLVARWAAAGASVLHLPRRSLLDYVVKRALGDALQQGIPTRLDFRRFASDATSRTELHAAQLQWAEVERRLGTLAPTDRRKAVGGDLLRRIQAVAAGETRWLAAATSGQGGVGLLSFGRVLRTVTVRPGTGAESATMMRALLEAVEARVHRVTEYASRASRLKQPPRGYEGLGAAVGVRTAAADATKAYAGTVADEFRKELASTTFWAHMSEVDPDLRGNGPAADVDLPTLAEITLLYAIVTAAGEVRPPTAPTDDPAPTAAVPATSLGAQWTELASLDAVLKAISDAGASMRNPFGDRFLLDMDRAVGAADREIAGALQEAGQRITAAEGEIARIRAPKSFSMRLTQILGSDTTEEETRFAATTAVDFAVKVSEDALVAYARTRALRDALRAVRDAAEARLTAYELFEVEAGRERERLAREANALLAVSDVSGFTHDHEVMTEFTGTRRLWDWYYLDQVVGVETEPGSGVLGAGGARSEAVARTAAEILASVRTAVATIGNEQQAAEQAEHLVVGADDRLRPELERLLRDQLVLESAVLLQVDYGRVEQLVQTLKSRGCAADALSALREYYTQIGSGATARATWSSNETQDVLGHLMAEVRRKASPLASVQTLDGTNVPGSVTFYACVSGALPAGLPRDVVARLSEQRRGFRDTIGRAAGQSDRVQFTDDQPTISPDCMFVYREQVALLIESFKSLEDNLDSLQAELAGGLSRADLFTASYFVTPKLSADSQRILREPELPLLGFDAQARRSELLRDTEKTERKVLTIALLLLAGVVRVKLPAGSYPGRPDATLRIRFERGFWHLELALDRDELIPFQEEEERLYSTGEDLLAIARAVRRNDPTFYIDPVYEVGDQARRNLSLFVTSIKELDRLLLSLLGPRLGLVAATDPSLVGGAELTALRSTLQERLRELLDQRLDPVAGNGNPHLGHYQADIVRMGQVLQDVLGVEG